MRQLGGGEHQYSRYRDKVHRAYASIPLGENALVSAGLVGSEDLFCRRKEIYPLRRAVAILTYGSFDHHSILLFLPGYISQQNKGIYLDRGVPEASRRNDDEIYH
jgi:hypothetical protein